MAADGASRWLDAAAIRAATGRDRKPEGLHLLRQGQAATKDSRGLATGPAFWARVDALGSRPCHPPADLGTGPVD